MTRILNPQFHFYNVYNEYIKGPSFGDLSFPDSPKGRIRLADYD